MQAVTCLVLRNGTWNEEVAKELVPGDVVKVKQGDRVPADLRICNMESVSLQIEEAPLTGESVSVEKRVEPMGANA